jgi:hypothetical protein
MASRVAPYTTTTVARSSLPPLEAVTVAVPLRRGRTTPALSTVTIAVSLVLQRTRAPVATVPEKLITAA